MADQRRDIKVILCKASLDGHWIGVQAVAMAFRDAGIEVLYMGMITAEEIVKVAIQEDADVIGLNIGASYEQVQELMKILKNRGMEDVLVVVGGVIPKVDIPKIKEMGVGGVFPPGSKLSEIVKFIKQKVTC